MTRMLLFLLLTCNQAMIALSNAGIYNIEEVRDITYDVDISSLPAGIDAYVDLSQLSEENMVGMQEKIMERVPKSDDPSYLFMTSKTGQRFACSLPQSDAKSNGVPESYNPKYLAEIVAASFYVKECIQKNMGWWTYELCRGRIIRQLHGAKNEADQVEYSLGMHTGRYTMPDFQTSTPDQLLYFEEWYEGGTMCDLSDKKIPRKTSVRYQCDPLLATNEAYIDSVDEQSSCEYVFVVSVGSLCKLKPFVHPNQNNPLQITCQPYITEERVKKYLNEILEKKRSKESARDRLFHAMDKVKRIQRRRTAMRRTELLKDGEVKKLKLRKELDNEYFNAATKYLADAYEARKGIVPPADTVEALAQLSTMMDDIDLAYYDYPSDLDEDRGNIWYYFNDPIWNKAHFPKSLDYVDIMNAYFDTALEQLQKFHPTAVIREYSLLRKNPWNPDENILVDSLDIRWRLMNMVPKFIARNLDFFDQNMARHMAMGRGIFGLKGNTVISAFIKHVESEFANGKEIEGDVSTDFAYYLAPAYKIVELTILEYNEYNEKWKQAVEADMIAMLDRLVVAYEFCQIRFDQQYSNHKLSFNGIGKDKATDIFFEEYFHSVRGARSPQTSKAIVQNYSKLMAEATRFVYRASFNHVWTKLSEDMLYERRSKGNERRSQMEAVRNTVGGVTGKIITTDASGIDAAKLMNLLSNAGLGDVDVNIELVRHGSDDTGDSDEMKEAMEDIIDQHLEQIRAVKKNKKREQAYDHVIDQ